LNRLTMGRFSLVALVLCLALGAQGQGTTVFSFTPIDIDENPYPLMQLEGRVTIVVNVATDWGNTVRDYTQLTELQKKYNTTGLTVLGFPCNQFANQEPGTDPQIKAFAESYGILQAGGVWMHKIDVNGDDAIPIYVWAKKEAGISSIGWNFGQFLFARNGTLFKYYGPYGPPLDMEPDIVTLLGEKP
jgi:glutathione peroxidase-family protein